MRTEHILAIIGAAAAIVLGVPAVYEMVRKPDERRVLKTVLLSVAVFALGAGVSALFTAQLKAVNTQSLPVQTLSFSGSNLELTPTQNSVLRKSDSADDAWARTGEFDYVILNVFEENGSESVFSGKASYTVGGYTSISLTGLAPGTYYCIFYGMKNDTEEEYYYLYYNPQQLFQWDGTTGKFL